MIINFGMIIPEGTDVTMSCVAVDCAIGGMSDDQSGEGTKKGWCNVSSLGGWTSICDGRHDHAGVVRQ